MKKFLLTLCIALLTIIASAQVSITVNVPTAGGFSAALTAAGGNANTVTDLTVTGLINSSDIFFMRDKMPVLAVLDMGSVQIVDGDLNPVGFPAKAFYLKSSLTKITFPSTLISIGEYAFFGCTNLSGALSIPNTVTSIGDNSFNGCSKLTGSLVIPSGVKTIADGAFSDCSGLTGTLTLPPSLTAIGNYTFDGCMFTGNLIIPNSLVSIGYRAFTGCSGFTGALTIPNSVTSIGAEAFVNCSGFNGALTLSNSLTTIEDRLFNGCSNLTGGLTIPNSVTKIGVGVFTSCSALNGNLILSSNVTSIGDNAFMYCRGLQGSLNIPNSVTSIGSYAFWNCLNLKGTFTLSSNIISIGEAAFVSSGIAGNLILPNSLTSIGISSFQSCSRLTGDLIIPNSIATIPTKAFAYCTNFKGTIAIPSSIASIQDFAFSNCQGITKIVVAINTPLPIGSSTFNQINKTTCQLIVPIGSTAAYKAATYWQDFLNIGESIFVAFNSQGGSAIADLTPSFNATIVAPANPTRTGYAFVAWYKEAACTTPWNFTSDLVTANTTLYAKWNINSYTVTFDSQLGSVVAPKTTNYNTAITAPANPTRTGYAFVAWYKEAACTNPWNFTSDKVTANTTLYAKWNINSYTVTFDSQLGSVVAPKATNYNTAITAPANPTRTGYAFVAWYKEAACTNPWNFTSDLVTANTTLYAKWNINSYTVTFDSQGGSAVASKATNYNTTISAPSNPTRTGYAFGAWYKEAVCTNPWNFTSDLVTANTTLYAKWNINSYTVTFDSQGGSAVASKATNYNTTISAPSNPTRTGYTFGGWYKETACTNAWNFTTDKITLNTTLYAKWTINTFTITFNTQSGSSIANATVNYNATVIRPADPTLTGYTFGGWYKDAACTNAWNFTSDKVTANTTLYAKWNINSYTVTFNSQGGDIIANINANYNTTITIPVAPTRMGYTFNGWYKETACTNAWNFATDKITANTTLFAKWTINTYTVTFNSDGGTPVSSITTNYFTKIGEPTPPSKAGYTFDGWYQNLSDAFSFNFSLYFITSNLTLTAKWTPITYGVSFYSEGISINYRGVEYNTTITNKPEDPTRTGYIFNGWYKEATFINLWNFATDKVMSTMSLYAKWTALTYKVSYDSQGGTTVPAITVNHGTKISEPTPPTRKGYTLKGWYNQPTNGFIFFFDYTQVTADITLYAHWMLNTYTITFDSKGGTSVNSQTAEYNSTIYAPTNPTRAGYTFDGWFKEEALTSAWNFATDVVSDNATLYAKWNAVVYTVIFNSQGGSSVSNMNANHGTLLTRPADPTRTGYTFAGWYIDASCTTAWNFATDVVTKATMLYAKWNINTYTVSFNSQGGSIIADVTCDYNNTIAEPIAPTRTGYTFAGWYKEYNYITAWNFATDLVSNNTTLYAKWSINIYTVNFDSQGGNAIASISATYNTTISAPTPPTKTGYKFAGWYKETACTNAWLFATDLVTVNMSLYAKWDLSNSINSTSTEDFRLYPNPADDFVTLEGSNMKQASIFNLMGTMIMQLDIKGNDTTTINVSKLMSGNYFIYVKTNDGRVRILKMLKL